MPSPARGTDRRGRLRALLACHPTACPAVLRTVWGRPSLMANAQRRRRHLSTVPPAPDGHFPDVGTRDLRWIASRHHPRAEVRRTAIARTTAERDDAGERGIRTRRRRHRGSRAAAPDAAAGPRIQSSRGSGSRTRRSCRLGAAAHQEHGISGGPSCRAASCERSRRVSARARGANPGRPRDSRRRCQYDGRDARGVRANAARRGGTRSTRAYRGTSRVSSVLSTSAVTRPAACSPSISVQPGTAAWRR